MAYQKKASKTETKQETKRISSEVKNLLLYVFEITESKNGWLIIRAKMSSKPVEGEKYGKGITVNLLAKIEECMIDDDFDEGWVRVDGTISAEDWKSSKGSSGTQLKVIASKIAVSEK